MSEGEVVATAAGSQFESENDAEIPPNDSDSTYLYPDGSGNDEDSANSESVSGSSGEIGNDNPLDRDRVEIYEVLSKIGVPPLQPSEENFLVSTVGKTLQGVSVLAMAASETIRRLCFHTAAYIHFQRTHLPVLLISPLVALIKKEDGLFPAALELRVKYLHEDVQIGKVMSRFKKKEVDVLLLSPKMLENIFHSTCYDLRPISLACIDNVESIPQLQAFQPTYFRLNKLLGDVGGCRLGLTAVATQATTSAVSKQLVFGKIVMMHHSSVIPENVQLKISCSDKPDSKMQKLMQVLSNEEYKPAIVYCYSMKEAKDVLKALQKSSDLSSKGIEGYLRDMPPSDKERVRSNFERKIIDIVVTTPVFGMGLQSTNGVIYFTMPRTYESLMKGIYQAADSRQQGYVHVLLYKQDLKMFCRFAMNEIPMESQILEQVKKIFEGQFPQIEGISDECLYFFLGSLESDGRLELPEPISTCLYLLDYTNPNPDQLSSWCKSLETKLNEQRQSRVRIVRELYRDLESNDDRQIIARFNSDEQASSSSDDQLSNSTQEDSTTARMRESQASNSDEQATSSSDEQPSDSGSIQEEDNTTAHMQEPQASNSDEQATSSSDDQMSDSGSTQKKDSITVQMQEPQVCITIPVPAVSMPEVKFHHQQSVQSQQQTSETPPTFANTLPTPPSTHEVSADFIEETPPTPPNEYAGLDYEPKLKDLMNKVASKIPTKWEEVGRELDIKQEDLNSIGQQDGGLLIKKFCAVFQKWKSQSTAPYTWETIIRALRAPEVSENALASRLKKKFAQ